MKTTRMTVKPVRWLSMGAIVAGLLLCSIAHGSTVILDEDFEDGVLDARMTVETVGTYNYLPGIKNITDFGSSKAFGYGVSTCELSCFDNYVTNLKITFTEPTYVAAIAFKDKELYGNWGSKGKIYVDGEAISWGTYNQHQDFGREPMNDGIADTTYRTHEFVIGDYVTTIELTVHDITTSSEILIDDLEISGGRPLPISQWTYSVLAVMLALGGFIALRRRRAGRLG